MKIPEEVQVGGFTYRVVFVDFLPNTEIGNCQPAELTIYLAKFYRDTHKPIPIAVQEQTYLHELVHSIDAIYLQEKLDEDTVDRISQGLYQALQ